jgi:hypothetical protein
VQALLDAEDHVTHGSTRAGRAATHRAARSRAAATVQRQKIRKAQGFVGEGQLNRIAPRVESLPVANRARSAHQVGAQAGTEPVAVRFAVALLQVGDHSGKRHGSRLPHAFEFEGELALTRAVQQHGPHGFRQFAPRFVRVERQLFGELFDQALCLMIRFFPPMRQALIAPSRIDFPGSGTISSGTKRGLRPKSTAGPTRAIGMVERKMTRRQFLKMSPQSSHASD